MFKAGIMVKVVLWLFFIITQIKSMETNPPGTNHPMPAPSHPMLSCDATSDADLLLDSDVQMDTTTGVHMQTVTDISHPTNSDVDVLSDSDEDMVDLQLLVCCTDHCEAIPCSNTPITNALQCYNTYCDVHIGLAQTCLATHYQKCNWHATVCIAHVMRRCYADLDCNLLTKANTYGYDRCGKKHKHLAPKCIGKYKKG